MITPEHIAQDTRFAVRQLRKHPGFTVTAILMLALGLCASVAIFAFVDAALLKPLPYRDPGRLVGVFEKTAEFPLSNLSYPDYLDWKRMNKVFSSLDIYRGNGFTLREREGAQPVTGARVSDGFFRTLGVVPILGRDFYSGEDLPSAGRAVIISHSAWQTRFAGNPGVIGQTVTLDGEPNTIVGVLPREFHFAPVEPADFFAALHATTTGCDPRRSCHSLYGVARLKDGVALTAAQDDVVAVAKQLEQQYPQDNRDQGAAFTALDSYIVGPIRPILFVLLGGAVLLLVIATVNVASLLLVRSESRRREIAVRTALGASRSRVFAQFVTEGLVLVACGTVLGLIASHWTMQALTRLIPDVRLAQMTFLRDLGLNARVLAFAGVVAAMATALFSVIPALRLSFAEMRAGLTEGSRGSAGHAWRRLGSKLVVVELATAMVLLVSAGLLGQSLYHLLRVDIGFRPDHIALLSVNVPRTTYSKDEQRIQVQKQIVSRIAALPGVQATATTSLLPVGFGGNTTWFRIIGKPWHGEHNDTPFREVTPDYFKTLRATLLRGRIFDESDDRSKPKVIVVNQSFARHHFPNEDALGKQITRLGEKVDPMEIIGIIDDIREGPLDGRDVPVMYQAAWQNANSGYTVVARTEQQEDSILSAMAAAIHQIDPEIVTRGATTMERRIGDSFSAYVHRLSALLVGGFAGVAFLLSMIGLYGVIAYSVSQRNREIGVRIALGAHPGAVYGLVLREAGWLAGAGIAIGVIAAIGSASAMSSLLFGVQSWDMPTLAAVAIVLGLAALLASYIPARRAASVNPVEALRAD